HLRRQMSRRRKCHQTHRWSSRSPKPRLHRLRRLPGRVSDVSQEHRRRTAFAVGVWGLIDLTNFMANIAKSVEEYLSQLPADRATHSRQGARSSSQISTRITRKESSMA